MFKMEDPEKWLDYYHDRIKHIDRKNNIFPNIATSRNGG